MLGLTISLVGALLFGALAWMAKHRWADKTKTQLFALIAIAFTLSFIIFAWGLE